MASITPPNGTPTSWAIGIYERPGETTPIFNAMRFDTEGHAKAYEADLGSRWFGYDHSEVVPTGDPPNYTFEQIGTQGGTPILSLKRLPEAV